MKRRDFFKQTLAVAGLSTVGASLRSNLFAAALESKKVLALAGTSAPGPSFYTRMFPELARDASQPGSDLEKGLIELGKQMEGDLDEPPPKGVTPPLAGYTYLGQFVDHDLTLDLTPLKAATPQAEQAQNFRTPFLDLDQVYGGGPNLSPFLYRNKNEDRGKESFLIDKTISGGSHEASEDDLPRNSEGIALTGDPRQDENLILAQLHVAFLKLHNRVLEQLKNGQLKRAGPDRATCFEQAKRLVTWHYQWIVRKDYLSKILDTDVLNYLMSPQYKPIMAALPGDFHIPVEFSAAAFRFGHSMVRNDYLIDVDEAKEKRATLKELLQLTGPGGGARPNLSAEWKVNWQYFFFDGNAQRSSPIDTRIAGGLYRLRDKTKALFSTSMPGESVRCEPPKDQPMEDDLPVINLLRGARMGLPSGQKLALELQTRLGEELAKKLRVAPLKPEQVATGPQAEAEILRTYGFDKDTPLWYYILKEAELFKNGHLGPTGSALVGDVIMSALLKDPDSYVSSNPAWKPTIHARKGPEFLEMYDLIRFVR